jgi:hypothetical protein
MATLLRNWKTTVFGVGLLACTTAFFLHHISLQEYLMSLGALSGGGLIASQDAQ